MKQLPVGVHFKKNGEAEIIVWAPMVKQVELVVDNNEFPLLPTDHGYWALTTAALEVNGLYKIRLDGKKEYPDPASRSQPQGVHGPSQAIDLSTFKWTDGQWINRPLSEYILYELHTGVFTPAASFAGIEDKIDYLVRLGINAIEIMPVAQFPGARNWGYDGVYPFAVQDSYGGAPALQRLINTCHRKGLAVVMDVVYNHLGPEGNYLPAFGPYFTTKYKIPWGAAVNLDDAWCDGVRNYILENVVMWFRDFHVDALRMDAVHALKDFGARNILQEIREVTDSLMAATGRRHHLIVECDLNDTRYINPVSQGGYGMDAQWIDEFHHALRVAAGGGRQGYYSDFNGLPHLAGAYKNAYVYNGIYSPHRKKIFGSPVIDNPGDQFIVFSQNHDQVGNRMLGERPSTLVGGEMQKLMAGAVMVSPFIPLLFMGEEYGEPHPFLFFVSHTDPVLRRTVREGRRQEFKAFHAEGEAPDPSDEETFNRSRLQWELISKAPHNKLLAFYKALISLRKENNVLKKMDRKNLNVSFNEREQTLTIERWDGEDRLICLMNFSVEKKTCTLPEVYKQMLFNSASANWNGPGEEPGVLQPQSFIIYV